MTRVALYVRVSTDRQDHDRQIRELKEFVAEEYPDASVERFADIISGTGDEGGAEYRRLREAITDGELDVVIVHELSRLSRLGGGEIHNFLQHALEHGTSVRDLEVGLDLDVDDSMVDQAVTQMIAGLMGDLARIEQTQKVRRIQSGIDAAQAAGKWTGRPPTGFEVVDGHLRVDPEEYLRVRAGMERVAAGESLAEVADDVGVAASTLRELYNDRPGLYLHGEADDDRVDAALEDIRPLSEPNAEPAGDLNKRLKRLEQKVENFD
ncbi:recombinase family protein [Halorubrum sp. BOL3-1]|uniref:recombinase family protein n=1 Tax=Halorubrum sp. BOL3-1 TaxID=2497325 RepID=UPI0010051C3E|nr:recombinase family protein [Halorubrum sp. BOL3-1]QAU14197.1 recombinase family protein [Halorubrum sp. BOL3-1]